MTIENEGSGVAQEDATQTDDDQEGRNLPENTDEGGEGKGDTPEPEPSKEGEDGEGKGDEPKPEPDKPKSPEARRRARDRERIETLQDQVRSLEEKRERILKAGELGEPPRPEDFDSDMEYAAAKAVHDAARKQSDRELKALDDEAKTYSERIAQERQQAFAEQVADARTRYRDWDDVTRHLPTVLGGNNDLAEAIMDSDQGADIAYFLSKNPAKAREIAAMNSPRMWREIGALESRLVQPVRAAKPAVPEPVEPVRGGGGADKPTPYTARSTAEYMRMMDKRDKERAAST